MAKKAKTKTKQKEFVPFAWKLKVSGAPNTVSKNKEVVKKLNKQTGVKPTKEFVSEAKKHRESLFKKK